MKYRRPTTFLPKIVTRPHLAWSPDARSSECGEPGRPVAALEALDPDLGGSLTGWISEHGWALVNYSLSGVAASPGIAEGTVRVIRGHDEMDKLMDGDVLVCQITSPAWAPLFPLASAVVADGGGALSHAAIAAREHGIPAVLGTGDGTSTLFDGQRVRIDGTRGLVFAD